jgi:hypothetical protein
MLCAGLLTIFVVGNLLGWVVHTIMHIGWFTRLSKGHMRHHTLYTSGDYLSETYRSAGKDDSAFIFIPAIAIPIIGITALCWLLTGVWWICAAMITFSIIVGWMNVYVHEAFHIRGHFLYRFKTFRELSRLHVLHHIHPKKNQGIIWFGIDRLMRTYISE